TRSRTCRRSYWPQPSSAAEDAGGAHGQGQEQKAERDGGRPGGPIESRGDAFDDADQNGAGKHAGGGGHAAEDTDRKTPADIIAADRRLDRLNDDQESASQ